MAFMSIENKFVNPFTGAAANPETESQEAYEKTKELLTKFSDYCRLLNQHLRDYQVQSEPVSFKPSEKRNISIRKSDSGNYCIEDVEVGVTGNEDKWFYEVNPTDIGPGSNKNGCLMHTRLVGTKTHDDAYFNFNNENQLALESLAGIKVVDLSEDGLHSQSPEQWIWDRRWSEYQKSLSENKGFLDFLDRTHNDEQLPWEMRKWANDLMRGNIKVEDADKFIEDINEYWRQVTGKELPRRNIPKFNDPKRPADLVQNHATTQRDIFLEVQRLKDIVKILDKHLLSNQSPYRTSGRDINRVI